MPDSAQSINFSLFRRVLSMAKPYRRTLYFTAALTVLLAPLAIARPKLMQIMVDDYMPPGDVQGMTLIAGLIFGVLLLEVIFRYLFLYWADWLGQATIRDLRIRVFNHITRLNLSYFDKTPIGQSTTRTINDIEAINTIFSEGSITILADLHSLVAVKGIKFFTSWKQTLVIVQIFNAEEREAEKFRQINRDYTAANLRSILAYAIFFPTVEIISALSLGLMVWYGARGVLSNEVTPGMIVAFLLYISMLYRPIRMLADKFNNLQMGLIAAERVFKLLETKETIRNEGTLQPKEAQGAVAFENVWFSYTGNAEEAVLKNVSFHIKPGDTLAIVGSTGSGKTTIISLLNRFYEIQSGSIKIDGHDLHEYDVYALRRRIAVVLQDVFLFSGTVLENITLRDSGISEAEVVRAAKMIGAHEFIEKLPGGYQYQVRERGATLSMGQRQLISFVRALVFNPEILILDEATSSIDPETERVIQYAIERLIARRTSIIIGHRLSTIGHANNILVLEKGEVKEFGPQEELLAIEGGRYRELYEKQFLANSKVEI